MSDPDVLESSEESSTTPPEKQPPSPKHNQQRSSSSPEPPSVESAASPAKEDKPSRRPRSRADTPGSDTDSSSSDEDMLLDLVQKEDFETFIHQDVTIIAKHFRKVYSKLAKHTKRANVLVAGPTGSGKSSLINSVFGVDLAKEGTGVPVTHHFTRYEIEGSAVVVYDSRGVEHGHSEEFIESTQEFFKEHHVGEPKFSADSIHVIWYVINSAGSRIMSFEEDIFRSLFSVLPIIFLMNKSDISSDEDRAILRANLEKMALPNCIGIFETVSGHHFPMLNVTKCPSCGSDDLNIRKKQRVATCESCSKPISLEVTSNERLIAKTLETLPVLAREAFIAAQTISCKHKESAAKTIISDYYTHFPKFRLPRSMVKGIAKMLVRLAILWDFREHGSALGKEIAKDLFEREFSYREKILIFLRQGNGERIHTSAMGILWNRCLRRLFMEIFIQSASTEEASTENWEETVRKSFSDLNEESLFAVEKKISESSLEEALESEMPSHRDCPTPLPVPLQRVGSNTTLATPR